MKTSLVTTLSVVGILATGGGAFAANTRVLETVNASVQDPPMLAEATMPFVEQSIALTGTDAPVLDSNVSTVPTDTSLPLDDQPIDSPTTTVYTVTPPETVNPTARNTVVSTSEQSVFSISGTGIVTLNHNSNSLEIVSVIPALGWTFTAENTLPTRVEVEFNSDSRVVTFRAELIDGRVVAAVSADDGDSDEDATKDAEEAAKIAADAAEKSAKAIYDATENSAKATYDATERTAKAAFDATERAAKETFESAERAAKENSDEAALTAAKETFEDTLTAAKETFEDAVRTALETFEDALRTAKEALESADD